MPLKHFGNFRRTLDTALINCEVSLTLTWSTNCVSTDLITTAANPNAASLYQFKRDEQDMTNAGNPDNVTDNADTVSF